MLHENVLPTTRDTDFGGVQHFFEGHGEFSLGRLCVARSRLIRMRCTVAIRPEARRQIYWTMVLIDTFSPPKNSLAVPSRARAVEAVIWGMPAVNYDLMYQAMVCNKDTSQPSSGLAFLIGRTRP